MTDPMWTVVLLTVLWLIVVVPMVLRRRDEGAGARSVARFSSTMRLLSRRNVVVSDRTADHQRHDKAMSGDPDFDARADDGRATVHVSGSGRTSARPQVSRAAQATATRRPVPASEESLMYPPDQHEMSAARRQMMTRRRRALAVLGAGTTLFLLLALITGSVLAWFPAVLLVLGLAGYVLFLRSQARRDRERRQARRQRQSARSTRDYDATARVSSGGAASANDTTATIRRIDGIDPRRVASVESVVRIDEDDVSLDHLDTIDLTGLYSEVELDEREVRRAG